MKLIVPDGLRDYLAEASRHPQTTALSLYDLRIGTKVRYFYGGTEPRFNGTVCGQIRRTEAGDWLLPIQIPCPDHEPRKEFNGLCTKCGERARGSIVNERALKILGLVPFRDYDGVEEGIKKSPQYWKDDIRLEYRHPFKRWWHWLMNHFANPEPGWVQEHSTQATT